MSAETGRPTPVSNREEPVVLLVDDEPTTLDTMSLQVGPEFRVVTAEHGHAALAVLDEQGPFAAVVSDKMMPGMDGLELLEQVRLRYPDTTRVLHTAQTELSVAVAAINDGKVFGFLCKPCSTNEFRHKVREAVEHHHSTVAERQILDQTLQGSLQALFGWMELASPEAFARAGRIRDLVRTLCQEAEVDCSWQIEVAAMASQLGAVTLPASARERLNRGLPLPDDEQQMTNAMPAVAARLLQAVPTLDDVVDIITALGPDPAGPADPRSMAGSPAVRLLRAAIEVDALVSRGITAEGAVAALERHNHYPPALLAACRRVLGAARMTQGVAAVSVAELQVGMRIAEDIISVNGLTLVGRGVAVSPTLLERLVELKHRSQVTEPILVATTDKADAHAATG